MKRTASAASALVLLAALSGCVSMDRGPKAGGGCGSYGAWTSGPPSVPGVQGPWGQPVAIATPSSASPPGSEAAHAMTAHQSAPLQLAQADASSGAEAPAAIQLAHGTLPGMPFHPKGKAGYPAGAVAAVGALTGPSPHPFPTKRTEVRFVAPDKMKVSWSGMTQDGRPAQGHIDVPGRYNFVQAAVYRLKLSDIPTLPGVELYPTLEVVPANARTESFLAHSAVPVSFTNEDFEQVQAGNYLVKVIYLPNPQFQDLAAAGPDEIVSSRLEPGADPLAEAHRRGNILLVIRLGNIDLELANSPPMDAPGPFAPGHAMAPGMPGSAMAPGISMPTFSTGNPNSPMMGQTLPFSPLPDVSVPERPQPKYPSAGGVVDSTQPASPATTEIISTDQKPAPKRRWWWPTGASNK
jgi:hypothetical protein